MKHVILIGIGLFTLGCSNAQKSSKETVPQSVKDAFAKKYPSAKVLDWEKEVNGFEAEFKLNKVEMSANFSHDGTFQEEEKEIQTAALPTVITEYCSKSFPGYKLSEAAKIIDATGKLTYEAELSKGKMHFDVLFDANGTYISKGETSEEKD